jgi:hypothetical protein
LAREDLRQLIHAAMCGWALLFPWIGKPGAIALAGAAVLFNAFVFPRLPIGASVVRTGEGRWTGVQWYPLSVLGLVLALPLSLAAGAWGVLAAGDAASNLVGRRLGRSNPLPWNRSKSLAGAAGFVLAALPVAWALMAWCHARTPPGGSGGPLFRLAAAGAVAGALVETLPVKVDDNLTVAAAAGGAMFAAAQVWADLFPG